MSNDKVKTEKIKGTDLAEAANRMYSDAEINELMKEPYVRDFMKICMLLNQAAPFVENPQSFGYWFFLKHQPDNSIYEVEFDVKIKATRLGQSNDEVN